MKKLLQIFIPFMIALLLDGLTKAWAEQAISSPILILGNFFRFTLGYNTGVAFGLFANGGIFPLIVTGVIISVLAAWLVYAIRSGELSTIAVWPVGLILGGAVGTSPTAWWMEGDGLSRFWIGYGTLADFNLADSFIVVGALLLLLIIPRLNLMKRSGRQKALKCLSNLC